MKKIATLLGVFAVAGVTAVPGLAYGGHHGWARGGSDSSQTNTGKQVAIVSQDSVTVAKGKYAFSISGNMASVDQGLFQFNHR